MSAQQDKKNRRFHAEDNRQKRQFHQDSMRYPDRWTKYRTIGGIIPGSKFIAFKTPLSEIFFAGKPETPFGLKDVVDTVAAAGKKLGLVIDLTNTKRYYEATDWANFGVEYKKIFCPGHTIHKETDLVQEFVTFVSGFLDKNTDADLIIGVHCTHGLNRTGFLICRYLITKENWTPEDAVKAFEEARGHEIERWEYKAALLGLDPSDKLETSRPESTNSNGSRKRDNQGRSGIYDRLDRTQNDNRIAFHGSSKRSSRNQEYYSDECWTEKKEPKRNNWNGYRRNHQQSNGYRFANSNNYHPRQRRNRHYDQSNGYYLNSGWRGFNQGRWNDQYYQQNLPRHQGYCNNPGQNPNYRNNWFSAGYSNDNGEHSNSEDTRIAEMKDLLDTHPR